MDVRARDTVGGLVLSGYCGCVMYWRGDISNCMESRREMAKRGELIVNAPIGYIKSDEHHWRRQRTGAYARRSSCCLRKSSRSAASGKLCCGFKSMACSFLRTLPREKCSESGPAMLVFIVC